MCYVNLCVPLPQCELYHWVDVLDRFDEILEEAATNQDKEAGPSIAAADSVPPTSLSQNCIYMCPKLSDFEVWCSIVSVWSVAFSTICGWLHE